MLGRRRRRWSNNKPTSGQSFVIGVRPTMIQLATNVLRCVILDGVGGGVKREVIYKKPG